MASDPTPQKDLFRTPAAGGGTSADFYRTARDQVRADEQKMGADRDSFWVSRKRGKSYRDEKNARSSGQQPEMFVATAGGQLTAPSVKDPFTAFRDMVLDAQMDVYMGGTLNTEQHFRHRMQANRVTFTETANGLEATVEVGGFVFSAAGGAYEDTTVALAAAVGRGAEAAVAPAEAFRSSVRDRRYEGMSEAAKRLQQASDHFRRRARDLSAYAEYRDRTPLRLRMISSEDMRYAELLDIRLDEGESIHDLIGKALRRTEIASEERYFGMTREALPGEQAELATGAVERLDRKLNDRYGKGRGR
jgi:hypothetical protein